MHLRDGRDLSFDQSHANPIFLPAEIVYIIAEFSSFKTRLALVYCNKWSYKTCAPLLYEEVYLNTPRQLCTLYGSKNGMHRLKKTRAIFMDHLLFCSGEWKGIERRLQPTMYIIHVLHVAISLRRLQFIQSHPDFEELHELTKVLSLDFNKALLKLDLVSDMSFLPNLEILVDSPAHCSLTQLCNNRALALVTRLDFPCVEASFFPTLDPSSEFFSQQSGAVLTTTLERIASSPYLSLSDDEAGQLLRDMLGPLRSDIQYLQLTVVSADSVVHNKPSPVHDPLGSMLTIVSTVGCTSLNSLNFQFVPKPQRQPANAQYATLKRLADILPECEEATFSHPDVTWCKRPPKDRYLPRPTHLAEVDWTPYVLDTYTETLIWWLDTLGLQVSDSEEQLRKTATQLRRGMRSWYSDEHCPGEHELYTRLSALVL